jgi:hypothetical protein
MASNPRFQTMPPLKISSGHYRPCALLIRPLQRSRRRATARRASCLRLFEAILTHDPEAPFPGTSGQKHESSASHPSTPPCIRRWVVSSPRTSASGRSRNTAFARSSGALNAPMPSDRIYASWTSLLLLPALLYSAILAPSSTPPLIIFCLEEGRAHARSTRAGQGLPQIPRALVPWPVDGFLTHDRLRD